VDDALVLADDYGPDLDLPGRLGTRPRQSSQETRCGGAEPAERLLLKPVGDRSREKVLRECRRRVTTEDPPPFRAQRIDIHDADAREVLMDISRLMQLINRP